MTDKTDFKRDIDAYHAKHGQFRVVQVPDLQYLMIDGHGDPNTAPAFTDAVEALYPVAYKLKFASKRAFGRDYVVMPLEGLWRAEDMNVFTASRDKSRWEWTLMNMVPDWVGQDMFARAVEQVAARVSSSWYFRSRTVMLWSVVTPKTLPAINMKHLLYCHKIFNLKSRMGYQSDLIFTRDKPPYDA